jgi:hypothetical protein
LSKLDGLGFERYRLKETADNISKSDEFKPNKVNKQFKLESKWIVAKFSSESGFLQVNLKNIR